MNDKKKNICILLARGGSKGIKNKNIVNFHGKPLVYYTIKPILESKLFDRIIVSTDSKKIKGECIKFGAEVPFLRPKKISKDKSNFRDAIKHAMIWIENNYGKYENVLYTYPTNPLRLKEDFIKAYKLLKTKKSELIISVAEDSHPIFWSNKLKKNLSMKNFVDPKFSKNRQELPKTYHVDGSIWLGKWEVFFQKKDFFQVNSHCMIFPKMRSIDIDDINHLQYAKIKYEKLMAKKQKKL